MGTEQAVRPASKHTCEVLAAAAGDTPMSAATARQACCTTLLAARRILLSLWSKGCKFEVLGDGGR